MRNLIVLMTLMATLVSCGNNKDVNGIPIRTQQVIEETLVCSPSTPDTCSSSRMVCRRENYYSSSWKCTIILSEEVENADA